MDIVFVMAIAAERQVAWFKSPTRCPVYPATMLIFGHLDKIRSTVDNLPAVGIFINANTPNVNSIP